MWKEGRVEEDWLGGDGGRGWGGKEGWRREKRRE